MEKNRLVDALGLVIKLAKNVGIMVRNGKPQAEIYSKVLECIAEAPTVDAVEVVHGRWLDRYTPNGEYIAWDGFYCSVCGKQTAKSNYCPNCGAKMDGWNEDG